MIVNRRARALAKQGPLLDELRRPRRGIEVVETSSLAELDAFAREQRATRSLVVLAGGDGSLMAGVSALARHTEVLPPIALVRGGTVGTVARNWSGARWAEEPVKHARRLLDDIAADRWSTVRRPTLRIRDETEHERLGCIFGAGLVARFFELYDAAGANGNADAAKIVARIFAGSFVGSRLARSVLDPAPCEIEVDGEPAAFRRLSLLVASVVPNLGLGMRLTYRAGERLDRFHVVGTPLGPRVLGPQMPLVLAGRPLLGERVDTLATRISLRFPPARGAYVLDGDLLRADRITVAAGPVVDVVS